jgi:hypothetical protein
MGNSGNPVIFCCDTFWLVATNCSKCQHPLELFPPELLRQRDFLWKMKAL